MSRVYLGHRPFFGRTPAPLAQAIRAAHAAGMPVIKSRIRRGFAVYALV